MPKVQVRKEEIENYARITSALDAEYGHEGWRWAQWAFDSTVFGAVLGSPCQWQEVIVTIDGKWEGMAAVDAVPGWKEKGERK